jgi:hypothetical protein
MALGMKGRRVAPAVKLTACGKVSAVAMQGNSDQLASRMEVFEMARRDLAILRRLFFLKRLARVPANMRFLRG